LLCTNVQREGAELSPDLASGLFAMDHYTKFGMASNFLSHHEIFISPRNDMSNDNNDILAFDRVNVHFTRGFQLTQERT
jgi:hypothetical protein